MIESLYFHYENRFSNGNQIISNEKSLKLKEIYRKMIEHDKIHRPTCDQILSAKKEWGLNPRDKHLNCSIDESGRTFSALMKCSKLTQLFIFFTERIPI
jgi:hypothetical protein